MEDKDIFISYASEDATEARRLYSILEKNGLSCWIALTSIPGGTDFAEEIAQAIKECKFFVVLISRKSQASQWVRKELNLAIENSKIILPFRLENCALTGANQLRLSDVQWYEAYPNFSDTVQRMIGDIRAHMNKQEVREQKAPPHAAGQPLISDLPENSSDNVFETLFQVIQNTAGKITSQSRRRRRPRCMVPKLILLF